MIFRAWLLAFLKFCVHTDSGNSVENDRHVDINARYIPQDAKCKLFNTSLATDH